MPELPQESAPQGYNCRGSALEYLEKKFGLQSETLGETNIEGFFRTQREDSMFNIFLINSEQYKGLLAVCYKIREAGKGLIRQNIYHLEQEAILEALLGKILEEESVLDIPKIDEEEMILLLENRETYARSYCMVNESKYVPIDIKKIPGIDTPSSTDHEKEED